MMKNVIWQKPSDSNLMWFWDDYICPKPVKPLTQSFFPYTLAAFERVQKEFFKGNAEFRGMFVNGYFYVHFKRATYAQFTNEQAEESIIQWESKWKKDIVDNLNKLKELKLESLSISDLGRTLLDSLHIVVQHWEIEGKVDGPALRLIHRFVNYYQEVYPTASKSEPFELLEDVKHVFIEINEGIKSLKEKVTPEIAKLLRNQHFELLPENFKKEFNQYLNEFGRKTEFMYDISNPAIAENPAPLINMLLHQGDQKQNGPSRTLRTSLRAEENETLIHYLTFARKAMKVKEDHKFFIEQRTPGEVRMICAEIAKRMVCDQILENVHDIGYLEISDLLNYCFGLTDPKLSSKVIQNREIHEINLQVVPIAEIGGLTEEEEEENFEESLSLSGIGASAGVVRGMARVITNVKEIFELQQGEILVSPWTDPDWTPLIDVASGIITETGGTLSHAAIVAREYKIPAVVNVKSVTKLIRTGQMIEMNGETGIVQLL